jgi:hypothetical protein
MSREIRALRRAVLVAALAMLPLVTAARPTPPPPAPSLKLGKVTVIEETRGTRKIVDAAGRVHEVMKRTTPAERKAAALRARSSREAMARMHHGEPASMHPASHVR